MAYIYAEGIYQLVDAIKDIKGITSIEEKDGVLWVLSYKKLIRFNGDVWERIKHPLNDPIDHQFTNNVQGREHCPRSGYWFTAAKKNSRSFFNQGDIFPDFESDWGMCTGSLTVKINLNFKLFDLSSSILDLFRIHMAIQTLLS